MTAGRRRACGAADGEHIGGDVGGQYKPSGGGRGLKPEVPCRKGAGRVHDIPGGRYGRAAPGRGGDGDPARQSAGQCHP